MRRRWEYLGRLIFLLVWLVSVLNGSIQPAYAQTPTPQEQASDLLARLTPEERVGQLFLVTFTGTDVTTESEIYDLIVNYHVGGVVLLNANDNFTAGEQILAQIVDLTRDIQITRWGSSQQSRQNFATGENYTPVFVPLFIGLAQEGNAAPYDQILGGITPLPSQMALGATWDPSLATQVGTVLGRELTSLGINLLLGPSLDVMENPQPEGASDLGTRSFGGDPYWVGQLGKAYVQGVHQGSQGQVAVIAKHFPGHGGSDRLPEEEVATVIKSLDELTRFDLVPFFSVTGSTSDPQAVVDGLLTSHIRYQGFQGNLRATTRPVSFDPEALKQLMNLPQIETWRQGGGLMVSDDLGSQAIRRYYNLNNQTFDMPRRVALNAFQAGNDLLYVADFSSGQMDAPTAARETLEFFAQKYREDPAFAQRVDQSVLRILTTKYRLYGSFNLNTVLASGNNLDEIGRAGQVTFDVARQAATLISPTQEDLDLEIPDPPNFNDRIVFITDSRSYRQCSTCPERFNPEIGALQNVVMRRYGPQAGGLVSSVNLKSFPLTELQTMLDLGPGELEIEGELQRANWVVFSMLDATNNEPAYAILSRFLIERPDLLQQKRLIVFAFGAPYYLDATNITKLTAYYALYSKAPQFIDMAAYLLFQELPPNGASPVSIPGISYDLNTALFPNPKQSLLLELDLPPAPPPAGDASVAAQVTTTPVPQVMEFKVGDVIPVRAGPVLDHNNHPVPDDTPVEFVLAPAEGASMRSIAYTKSGIARTTFTINTSGTLEIYATSDLARSNTLRFEIPPVGGEAPLPTATSSPTPTPEPTITPTTIIVLTPTVPPELPGRPQFYDWVIAILVSAGIGWSAYRLASLAGYTRWGLRSGFLALIGGLLAYSYLALQMPGSEEVLSWSVSRGVLLGTLAGAGAGLALAGIWRVINGPPPMPITKDRTH